MTVSVPILTDNINDPGESFIARLSSPSGAALGSATEATVNIIDTNREFSSHANELKKTIMAAAK